MALQDTGLDFYESSMRPVRAGIQNIVTRADQNRKELEAQRLQLAAEERAEARALAREKRVEDATIRAEKRRVDTARSLKRDELIAVAQSRGLATSEPDGSESSNEVLQVRIDMDAKQRGPLETARINSKFLKEILPAETIDRIRTGDISAKELTAINEQTKVEVAALAAAANKERLREGPNRLWEVAQAKKGLKRINKELTEIQGEAVWKHAQGVVERFEAGQTTDAEYVKIAGSIAITDPNAARIVSKPEVQPATARYIIDRHPDGSPKRDSNGDNLWIAVADLDDAQRAAAHARGEIEVKGLAWAMQNKPAHVMQGTWPVGVNPEGKPFHVYDPLVGGDATRQHLLVAYGVGMEKAKEIAVQREQFDWWSADLKLDVEKLKFSAKQPEIQALLGRQTKIYDQYPELWDYDPNTDTTRPEDEIAARKKKKTPPTVSTSTSETSEPSDTSNAVALLEAAATADATPAAPVDVAEAEAAVAFTPALPAAVTPAVGGEREPTATELADAQARVDLPLGAFIEQSKEDDPVDYWDMTPEERAKEDAPLLAQEKAFVAANPYGLPLATDAHAALQAQRLGEDNARVAALAADPQGAVQRAKRAGQEQRQYESTPEHYVELAAANIGWQRDKHLETAATLWLQSDRPPNPPLGIDKLQLRDEFIEAVNRVHSKNAVAPEAKAAPPSVPAPKAAPPQAPDSGLDDQDFSDIMSGKRPATSEEAKEGLAFLRDTLYQGGGTFAGFGGDYDPRLPGAMKEAENAIRGQLGQAPPPLGQAAPTAPQGYGEVREAPLPVPPRRWAIPPETPADRAREARLYHLYRNPLYGRGRKGGQRLMELASQGRR